MPDPTWLGYLFAAVMMVVGAYCLARLVLARPMRCRTHYDMNLGHLLMSFAMVGMLVPTWNIMSVGVGEIVFGAMAVWFLVMAAAVITRHGISSIVNTTTAHLRHFVIHGVMACIMLYMYWLGMPVMAKSSAGGMGGGMGASTMSGPPAGAGDPGLTFFLILVLVASAVWQLNAIERYAPSLSPALATVGGGITTSGVPGATEAENRWMAPRLEIGCHIAMCVAMAYMLVLMV